MYVLCVMPNIWLFSQVIKIHKAFRWKLYNLGLKMGMFERMCCCQASVFSRRLTPSLCLFPAGNDVKDIFASARSGEQYRVLKIVIEDGKLCLRVCLRPLLPRKSKLLLRLTLECQHEQC